MCVQLACHAASICYPQPPDRDSGFQSVQLDARERWPGQSEEQATEIVNRSFWAPAIHRVINVATAPLDQPLCPVQAPLLFGVVEGSKRLGHSKPDITLRIYAHLFRKDAGKAAAAINAALNR